MFKLDIIKFRLLLKEKGHRSIQSFASDLKLHRNTVFHYLRGGRVFNPSFELMAERLGVKAVDLLREDIKPSHDLSEEMAKIVDTLSETFSSLSFILLGSRTRGRAHPYSDWDIGFFSRTPIAHDVRRRLYKKVEDLAEDLPVFVDLVDLSRADAGFLKQASRDWKFLTGSQRDWRCLQERLVDCGG